MLTDPMQEAVYEAERSFWGESIYRNDFPTASKISSFISNVLETGSVEDVAPTGVARLKPIINANFVETHPGVFVSDVMCGERKFFLQLPRYTATSQFKCTPDMVGLMFPEHGRNAPTISHELSHLLRFLELGLVNYSQEDDHGREFQETYVSVVRGLDLSASHSLRNAFHNVCL